MLYLLDANTLIDAKRDYYPIERIPEFWEWVAHQGSLGKIKIPIEIYEEFSDSRDKNGEMDSLAEWAADPTVKEALLLEDEANQELVSRIIYDGYVKEPRDDQIKIMGRDPFLLSYALKDIENICVVSTEKSIPSKKGANRKVPDVCRDFEIICINSFKMIRELDFSTNWKNKD